MAGGKRHFCYVDRKTRIVMRQRKAVQLGFVEFAIFYALHKHTAGGQPHRVMLSNALFDEAYRGVANPASRSSLGITCSNINKKLAHLGLKIVGSNHKQNSFYRIVEMVVQNETRNPTIQQIQNLFANKIKVDSEIERPEQTNTIPVMVESI